MSRHIERKVLEASGMREVYPLLFDDIKEGLDKLRARPEQESEQPQLNFIARSARLAAENASVIEPDSERLCQALRVVARARTAIFVLASQPGREVTLPVDEGAPIRIVGTVDTAAVAPYDWCQGFFAAATTRQFDALERLAQVDEQVFAQAQVRSDEWIVRARGALAAHISGAPDTLARIVQALEATDPERVRFGTVDAALEMGVPWMEMLLYLERREQAPFAQAFEKALDAHARRWQRPGELSDPRGYLALGPLGLASLGHLRGLHVDVTSEYAPRRLIEGACETRG